MHALEIAEERRPSPIEGLDEAALLSLREPPILRSVSILNAGGLITSLYNLSEGEEDLLSHSPLCKALEFSAPIGLDVDELRIKVKRMISLQHYCGWLPDYFRGELALRGAACCGFVLPMALSGYLGYTGDLSFLCEEINYSEYVGGSLDRAEKSIIFDTAYEHAIRSILCVPSNEYGLPHFEHQGSVFEAMGIAGEFSDIAAALFLRKSIESMLEYASDCRLRLKLVEIERKLTDGIREKAKLFLSDIEDNSNALAASSFMFCADEKADGERIDKLTGLCRDALSEGKILPLYGLFLSEALVEKDYVDHAVDLLDALGDRRLNPVERAMVKRILIKGLCGIDFKLGRMRIAPRFEKFRIMFSYKAHNVDVDYAFRFWDGIEINGLKYNNLDYADLNGYNRDIRIRL